MLKNTRIGIVVCFDRHYPESIQTEALMGADVILIPTVNTKEEKNYINRKWRDSHMEKVIEVSNLTKEYKGKKAVDNLSFDVYEGEILGLLGPNGSGKSTTINSILALLKYQGGSIKIFGEEMKPDSYDIKAKIGVIFQDVAVFNELNVYDNINYFCGLYIKDKNTRKQYVEDAINLVGLGEFKKYLPKQLSGGLLRRLNIACGIAHKPKLIFLDEPTVAVDPQSRNNILDGIKKLRDNPAVKSSICIVGGLPSLQNHLVHHFGIWIDTLHPGIRIMFI